MVQIMAKFKIDDHIWGIAFVLVFVFRLCFDHFVPEVWQIRYLTLEIQGQSH